MPLIIHPSSCCDVCLEALTYNDKPPFAIPCGHIFCRSCLFDMDPSLCPLCRKPFLPDRSKKLITGELEVREAEGIEDNKAIELLLKLVQSLDTEGYDSTALEIDLWLSAGSAHTSLQKAHDVFKEYGVLKSERNANLRLIRRLQRDMYHLQIDQSTEKRNASTMERELMSQIEGLQKKIRKLERGRRAATTITFNRNPLPTPPEPFPLESLPFFANLQQDSNFPKDNFTRQSSDRTTQDTAYLNGVLNNTSVEGRAAAASRTPDPNQTSNPPDPLAYVNEHTNSRRRAIISGASPNQRLILGTAYEDSSSPAGTDMYGQTGPSVDPFVLATGYFTEYAAGFGEGYHLSQRHLQSPDRRNRQARLATEPSAASVEPLHQFNASASRTSDDRLLQQLSDIPITSQSSRRPLGLRDFYTASTTGSSSIRRDDDPAPARVSSLRQVTLSSGSSTHDETPEWQAPSTLSTPPASIELHVMPAPADRALSPPAPRNSMHFRSPQTTSVPSSSVTVSPDATSSPSSRTSGLSRVREQQSRNDMAGFEMSLDLPMRMRAPISPNSSLRRRSVYSAGTSAQPSPSLGATDSPASPHTMDSWGTLSTNNPNRVLHRPFRSVHQINSVSDLGLRLFDDLSISNGESASQRSSLLSDAAQSFSGLHTGLEGSDDVGNGNGFQNRTPRVVPQPLPETYTAISPLSVPSQDEDRHWNISSTTHLPYRDLDHNHSQHHGTPSAGSDTWHYERADRTSIRSTSYAHTHPGSRTIPDLMTDRLSRASRQRTSHPSPGLHDNSTSPRWEAPLASTNALGLTDSAPSPELRISAPTPMMPSRSFLSYYN